MSHGLRKRLLSSAAIGMLFAIAAVLSPMTVRQVYADEGPQKCRCAANCLLQDCECEGYVMCACVCTFFVGNCVCDEFPLPIIPTGG